MNVISRNSFLVAALSPLLTGCGTFADAMAGPADDHLYYRGVRMDVAAIQKGVNAMAIDLPFSAVADTLCVPSIAYHQLTDPPGTKHKSAVNVIEEEMVKSVHQNIIVPIAQDMAATEAEMRRQQGGSQMSSNAPAFNRSAVMPPPTASDSPQ